MVRSPADERPNTRGQGLRLRRIAAFSTPPATAESEAPRLRWTIDQSCRAQNVTLTEERRRLAMIFDETDAPLSVSEVWSRAKARHLRASRSHIYVLIRALVASKVLIIAENSRAIRYAAPLATRLEVRGDDGRAPTPIEDPLAVEALIAALQRAGRSVDGRDLVVDLVAREQTLLHHGKR